MGLREDESLPRYVKEILTRGKKVALWLVRGQVSQRKRRRTILSFSWAAKGRMSGKKSNGPPRKKAMNSKNVFEEVVSQDKIKKRTITGDRAWGRLRARPPVFHRKRERKKALKAADEDSSIFDFVAERFSCV